jgi:hypothetical protein
MGRRQGPMDMAPQDRSGLRRETTRHPYRKEDVSSRCLTAPHPGTIETVETNVSLSHLSHLSHSSAGCADLNAKAVVDQCLLNDPAT